MKMRFPPVQTGLSLCARPHFVWLPVLLLIAALPLSLVIAAASAGDLDPDFGAGGKVRICSKITCPFSDKLISIESIMG